MHLPLNALRAFEVAARHLSFTSAADELNVTQTAVSMQVKNLEERLGVTLFRRLPRGLALTDEGLALLPVLAESFERIATVLSQFENGRMREVLTLGAVGTFAVGWLMPRLREFQQTYPFVDLRLLTNNNRVDLAGEGLDYAIRFGDGAWHGTDAERLFAAPLSPMCAPALAARLRRPQDLAGETLLRSYRTDEWNHWFAAAGAPCPPIRGFVFDSSLTMAEAVAQQAGVALLPVNMFERELRQGRLACPFDISISDGAYWLTRLKSRQETPAMQVFRSWLLAHASSVA
ncbi:MULTISPECIES: LysR family transcriptional regulator [unclassified Herbaspirillum]|uniref:LysR family transcriptional regulator n=1 Tax=unclassified Herbaspirillum TaxID=2624150 RepID=UPI000E2E933D|nr:MULTISPECIES: LysR family transcriptional regulator [unclassified Herbaspirillum]RFB69897.1 LysR family transcriptional regulator [Herbaspirillum sp. 3R-3a1]TFI07040.1 LysR family transcriptional regulator [Herbaspirillum sp. 3R11]TFI12978.1 LysR family transcriptional regulator [Herbaspirillum sp. 3R-11]TFI19621.1 LysR family transcriptional regulator [Herbaspirillum sp. 3C11]TFI19624.1 LysR family transcriptional regulator [Herbaspirillum sp. 3C11]